MARSRDRAGKKLKMEKGNHAMANPRLVDLTVSEFRALVRETVIQSVTELLGDPDEGLAVRDEFRRAVAAFSCGS